MPQREWRRVIDHASSSSTGGSWFRTYAYKSAKWLRRIRFTEKQESGFWEKRGYSDTANGWTEVRFSS